MLQASGACTYTEQQSLANIVGVKWILAPSSFNTLLTVQYVPGSTSSATSLANQTLELMIRLRARPECSVVTVRRRYGTFSVSTSDPLLTRKRSHYSIPS